MTGLDITIRSGLTMALSAHSGRLVGIGRWLHRDDGARTVPVVDPGYSAPKRYDRTAEHVQVPETMDSGEPGGFSQETFAAIAAVAGFATSAVGTFYSLEAQKDQLKTQALNLEFQREMSQINARIAEEQAQLVLMEGHREVGRLTMAAGRETATRRARIGARGIVAGVGSAAEELASVEIVKQRGIRDINSAAMREANALRAQGVNFQNAALLTGVSGRNARRTAGGISPAFGAVGRFGSDAGQIALALTLDRRRG